ncbi:hypothetical protein QNO21_15275 [Microbacterium sp. zg-Y818]|uniref:hypothetical protein n=1 Tax=unclassified Microbacterium TaxID=2609290 RepID=UPI00214ACE52|nr:MULTISPECIES: hypothetical protein [unclassified Microbacterium]MCR2800490.1 hypothetical protein [Microbacterium sp. zg.Y818]WIM22446.1 hypothetical protein QNO21_15275 [Microbacterium sp. zg-Y818]
MTHPTTAASVPLDTRPLTQRVDRADARAFTKELRASGRIENEVMASIIGYGVALLFFVGLVLLDVLTSRSPFRVALSGATPLIVVLLVCALVAVAVTFFSQGRVSTRRYRLDRFARANGMRYVPEKGNPSFPGMIFGSGSYRRSFDVVQGKGPRRVEFANYVYTTGSGKHRRTHRWGYVAVKLDIPLPHIVLDATGNNSLFGSNLPTLYKKEQRLSLEGDFDRHFALYCPEGYERDALYLFTPDVMARFIDNAAELDVEIVDDWLLMYTKRNASTTDPATWEWLFGAVAAVLDKLDQWERWRDERLLQAASGDSRAAHGRARGGTPAGSLPFAAPAGLLRPPPGVAPQGRRLTTRFPWLLTGLCVVAVVVYLLLDLPG